MLKWNELDNYICGPVYDLDAGKWRILDGYKRVGNDYQVRFTDLDCFEDCDVNCTNLFRSREEAKNYMKKGE